MAHQKTCSGSTTINNWFLGNPGCSYDVTLLVAGQPINTPVTLNPGMTTSAIAALFNANRTGNTTGTVSASQVGNDLILTINNIVLLTAEPPTITASIVNLNPGPCGDFTASLGTLTCNVNPDKKKKRVAAWAAPSQVCIKADPNNPNFCPPEYVQYNSLCINR